MARKHHDFRPPTFVTKRLGGAKAADAGHRQVNDGDIGLEFTHARHRFFAAGSLAYDLHINLRLDQETQPGPDDFMIVRE
jgi:hypothetical protein